MWKRLIILSQAVVVLGSFVQMLSDMRYKRLTKRRAAERLLSWSLPINGGLLEIVGFLWHTLRGKKTADGVDPTVDNTLRKQVAIAHLAFGVLGVLSIWFRGTFWFATVIGQAIFLTGISIAHAHEMQKQGKPFVDILLFFDVLMSLAHIGLLRFYNPLEVQPRPRWQRAFRSR